MQRCIVLVIGFGRIERLGHFDSGGDRRAIDAGLVELLDIVFRNSLLPVVLGKNRRAVLRAAVRFLPFLSQFSKVTSVGLFVGISYLSFRSVRLTVEVRNGVVPVPTISYCAR